MTLHASVIYPKTSRMVRNRVVDAEGLFEFAALHKGTFKVHRKKNKFGDITIIRDRQSILSGLRADKEQEYVYPEDYTKFEPCASSMKIEPNIKGANKKSPNGKQGEVGNVIFLQQDSSCSHPLPSSETTYHLAIRDALNSAPQCSMSKSQLHDWLLANQFFASREDPKSTVELRNLESYLPLIKCFAPDDKGNWTYSADACKKCQKDDY